MSKSSLHFELDEYFSSQHETYTKFALTQDIAKLDYSLFTDIYQEILNHYYKTMMILKLGKDIDW